MEPGNGTAAAIDANHPLSDIDHPAWQVREQLRREAYAEGVRHVSEQMVGAVEALLPLGDDALRAGMTMLCEMYRSQRDDRPADWSRIRFEARNAGRTTRGDGTNCPVRLDGTGPHPQFCVECAAEAGARAAVRHLAPAAPTVDASRAQSAAELLDQFLTDLDTWASRCGLPGAPVSLPAIRWFVEGWLAAGEIPPPPDADAIEDAQCITTQAAIAHIDALTRGKP
jgi:hypothetical protein